MAIPGPRSSLQVLVFVLGIVGHVTLESAPVCSPVCKEHKCPVKLSKLDNDECICRMIGFSTTNGTGHRRFKLQCVNNIIMMKLFLMKRKVLKDNSLTLIFPKGEKEFICFNIEKTSFYKRRIKIECTPEEDSIKRVHLVQLSYMNGPQIMPNISHQSCKKYEPTALVNADPNSENHSCWQPKHVYVYKRPNLTLTVAWDPFFGYKDIRIRVEKMESSFHKRKFIHVYELCPGKLHNWTFSNLLEGTYVAKVGALGCDYTTLKSSDRITIEEDAKVSQSPLSSDSTQEESYEKDPNIAFAVLIGAIVVFVAILSAAIFYIRRKSRYSPLPLIGDDAQKIVLVSKDEQIGMSLSKCVKSKHTEVITREGLNNHQAMDAIIMYVSLEDVHTFQNPDLDKRLWERTITVLMDYTVKEDQSPLVVHVPRNIPHPGFRGRQNNHSNQVIAIDKALGLLDKKFDKKNPDFVNLEDISTEVLKEKKDSFQRILIISGFLHEHHKNSCLNLTNMLKKLNKEVYYDHDDSNRQQLKEYGCAEWTLSQLRKADLVIVVISKYLYKLVDCYKREQPLPQHHQLREICAAFALLQLHLRTLPNSPKIAFVSFGYESQYVDDIIYLYPNLQTDMKYDLVETKDTDFSDLCGDADCDNTRALKIFLNRLSSDRRLVEQVCEESKEFFRNTSSMAAVMASGWMKRFGSMNSLTSIITASVSMTSWEKEWEMYRSEGENMETTV